MGGAVGIGLMGMLFNLLTTPHLRRLGSTGVNPAELMDPRTRSHIPPETLAYASDAIGRGLTWVFGAMLLAAVAQTAVSLLLPAGKCRHPVRASEAMESMAG
jgi:hypothetical protein